MGGRRWQLCLKIRLKISFFTIAGASLFFRHIARTLVYTHICLQHPALLRNTHILYIDYCQGGDFVVFIRGQFCKTREFANQNTSRHWRLLQS
jgi:hypothetical protein